MRHLPCWILLFSAGFSSVFVSGQGSGPQINQDREVDFEYCYLALNRHDDNENKQIDEDEFLDFAQDFGGNTECWAQVTELPLELLTVWNQLSCECRSRGGADDCCLNENAHIPISGVLESDPVLVEEQFFLTHACLQTDQAIISYCGPPPGPVIPGPPGAGTVPRSTGPAGLPTAAAIAIASSVGFLILLFFCCRRRFFLFAGAKDDDDEESSVSSDESSFGGERHLVTTEGGEMEDVPLDEEEGGGGLDADANKLKSVAQEEEESGDFGGARYGRSVEDGEWEDLEPPTRPAGYEQYDLPDKPDEQIKLKPVIIPPPPPDTEDPYELEHYVPDGGVVQHERTGEWSYDADGGWTPAEGAERQGREGVNSKYQRQQRPEAEIVDNRRQRHLESLGGAAIFDQLDEDPTESSAVDGDMFDWVIRSTLNTLDLNTLNQPAVDTEAPEPITEEPEPVEETEEPEPVEETEEPEPVEETEEPEPVEETEEPEPVEETEESEPVEDTP